MTSEQVLIQHLTKLNPREAWPNEAYNFTPWLAEDENFQALATQLHLVDAQVEQTEFPIGGFSADIVGKDRDGFILIENQLETTDHTHLGQIVTYLAGLETNCKVVWISTRVKEEHRAAIDWLNENTSDGFSFFAVELELIKIGESSPAPLFHVVAKPNNWTRHASARSRVYAEVAQNERQSKYKEFWSKIAGYFDDQDPSFRGSNPPKDHWWQFPTGRTGYSITLTAGGRDHYAGIEFYVHNDEDKSIFDDLLSRQNQIEEALGSELQWERLDERKGSRIARRIQGIDPFDPKNEQKLLDFYWTEMIKFRGIFLPIVRELD